MDEEKLGRLKVEYLQAKDRLEQATRRRKRLVATVERAEIELAEARGQLEAVTLRLVDFILPNHEP